MNTLSRRQFLRFSSLALVCGPACLRAAETAPAADVAARIHGLLLGTAFGDALGGPIEFQAPEQVRRLPDPPKVWSAEEVLDAPGRAAAAARLRLRSYRDLRPKPDSYGQWNVESPPGTITDDTRHKLVLLAGLRKAEMENRWPFSVRDLARAYLDWPASRAATLHPEYAPLAADWLEEWQLAARWVLGERGANALPPERMWQGLPTCCGQMTLLPVAALFAGQPERAYRAAYHLAFFDNGWGRDMNAVLVAGLATALVVPVEPRRPARAWEQVLSAIRVTDPFRYGSIRWTRRAVHRWLDLALQLAREAEGRPARLFAALESEFKHTIKWEAQVPFVVAFACLALAEYDALAALQLSIEWGHDTDSYAQLVGAFLGALHGPELFAPAWREAVTSRLMADHEVDLAEEARRLDRLRQLAGQRAVISGA